MIITRTTTIISTTAASYPALREVFVSIAAHAKSTINSAYTASRLSPTFTTAIPVELLIVPLGLSVGWLEFGRFLVLRRRPIRVIADAER